MGKFSADVREWAEKSKKKCRDLVSAGMIDVYSDVVESTVVVSGNLIGSWWASVNNSGGPSSPLGPGRDPGMAIVLEISGYTLGDTVVFSNGAVYAAAWEFGHPDTSWPGSGRWRAAVARAPATFKQTSVRFGVR